MRLPYALQVYFMQIHEGRPSAGIYSVEDGRVVGHLLMDVVRYSGKLYTSKRAKRRQAAEVAKFVMRTAMLGDAAFGHLCDMLRTILVNKYHVVREVAATDPALLTRAEAIAIGESCKAIRLRHLSPKTAVDGLLHHYAALRTFAQSNGWVRPLLETIFYRQTQASKLDRFTKVLVMAGMSLFDIATDLVTIAAQFRLGHIGTALSISGLVLLSQGLQIVIVVVKNVHLGRCAAPFLFGVNFNVPFDLRSSLRRQAVLKEIAIVLSFFKPTVDVARLLRGYEVAGAPFTTHVERTSCKVIESVAESIPTMLIQLAQSLGLGVWSWVSLLSISVSWMATASKAAMIAFDLDCNLANRTSTPEFYGFVPDEPRRKMVSQALLVVVSLAHVIGRSVAVSLLVVTEPAWVAAVLAGDVGLMYVYKIARNDLYVWVPGSGIGVALLYRLMTKLMCDFTALLHLRHPFEMGLWWAVSMVLNQAECFLAAWLYVQYYKGPGKFESSVLYTVLGSLTALWAVAFVAFLLSIKRSHVHTFFSLDTGAQFSQRKFTETEDDAKRSTVFRNNHRLWGPIRVEVADWIELNWPAWKQDPPTWFTQDWIDQIPDDMLPKSLFAAMMSPQPALGPAGKVRRRSTVRKSILLQAVQQHGLHVPDSVP